MTDTANADVAALQSLARKIADHPIGSIGITQYALHDCAVIGYGLLSVPPGDGDLYPGGAVQYCPMPEGTAFPVHSHEYRTEWLVCIGGRLEICVGGDPVILSPGDAYRIQPGVPHTASALSDCLVVGIIVPRDGGYPDGWTPGDAERLCSAHGERDSDEHGED